MSSAIPPDEAEAVVILLARGLCQIRLCQDIDRARAIADALHNVPDLLRPDGPSYWTLERLQPYLDHLAARYPDLGLLQQSLEPFRPAAGTAVLAARALRRGDASATAAAARREALWSRAPLPVQRHVTFVNAMVAGDLDAAETFLNAYQAGQWP
jgi:hypothetical protein